MSKPTNLINNEVEKVGLFTKLYRMALEKFPSIDEADVGDLDEKGFAFPIMFVFYGVFFGTFIYYTYSNITQNISTRFLSPVGEDSGLVCESVPVPTDATLRVDGSGVWSTELSFEDSTSLYTLELDQAKYYTDPWVNFNDQIEKFQSNFKIQTDRGKNRDFAWNLILGMTYKDTRAVGDGNLEAGIATFKLSADARVAFSRSHIVGVFGGKEGVCAPNEEATLDSTGHFVMDFNQRFQHGYYTQYYYEYAHDPYAYFADYFYYYDDDATQYDFEYSNDGDGDYGGSYQSGYDFNYAFYYYELEFWYTHDAVFVADNVCAALVNSADLGYTTGIVDSKGFHNKLELKVDLASAAVAVAINFKMIPLSELVETSIPPPLEFRRVFGASTLAPKYYFHAEYTPMDPVLCVTDDRGTPNDDDDDIPFCLVKVGRLFAFPVASQLGYFSSCTTLEMCSCDAYSQLTDKEAIVLCETQAIQFSLIFYQHDRDARKVTHFARSMMQDYHADADFDLAMVEKMHSAFASTMMSFAVAAETGSYRMNRDFPLYWNLKIGDAEECSTDSFRQQMHKKFTELCSDDCTLLTFITYNAERSHSFNEYALSAHTLQCSDAMYSEDLFADMLDTQPSITMTQEYEICRYSLTNAISVGIATAFSSATFFSGVVLIATVLFVVKGYNLYHWKRYGKKYFKKASHKDKFEKDSLKFIVRGLVQKLSKSDSDAEQYIALFNEMDRIELREQQHERGENDGAPEEELPEFLQRHATQSLQPVSVVDDDELPGNRDPVILSTSVPAATHKAPTHFYPPSDDSHFLVATISNARHPQASPSSATRAGSPKKKDVKAAAAHSSLAQGEKIMKPVNNYGFASTPV